MRLQGGPPVGFKQWIGEMTAMVTFPASHPHQAFNFRDIKKLLLAHDALTTWTVHGDVPPSGVRVEHMPISMAEDKKCRNYPKELPRMGDTLGECLWIHESCLPFHGIAI